MCFIVEPDFIDPPPGAPASTDACLATMAELFPDHDSAPGECVCADCLEEVARCFEDAHCFRIFQCATWTGCFGTQCYQPDFCMREIDAAGVSSEAVASVTEVGNCSDSHNCPRAEPRPKPPVPGL